MSDDDKNFEEDVSIYARVRKVMLQGVMLPLMKDLREGDPALSDVTTNDLMCGRNVAALKFYSDTHFLSLLKRLDISNQLTSNGISLGKVASRFTECRSARD